MRAEQERTVHTTHAVERVRIVFGVHTVYPIKGRAVTVPRSGTAKRNFGAPYTRAELLVVDEVGLEQVERNPARRSGLMQKVLLPRYIAQRSTIITSNIPWDAWGDYLDDHLGAAALIDRMIHHSHVIVINGPSYRDWAHQQEAAVTKNTAKATTKTAAPASKSTARATSGGAHPRRK